MKKIMFIALTAFMIGCGDSDKPEKKEDSSENNSGKVNVDRLKELDDEFRNAVSLDEKKAKEFVALCMEYADTYPENEDVPGFLEKGGLVAGAIRKYKLKANLFDFILDKYPDYPNYNNILYMQAVCWDTELKNNETAKKYYLMVKEKHQDPGIIESINMRLSTIDSLTYDQHVEMLLNKAKNTIQ